MDKLSKIVTDAINHPVGGTHPQNAYSLYRQAANRLANQGSPAEREASRQRWPTIGDANRAMVAAYAAMSDEDKADDLSRIEADLNLISIGL